MRLVIDSLIALMLVVVLGGVILYFRHQQATVVEHQRVHQALADLQETALLKGALGEVQANDAGFPLDISPVWFGSGMPVNPLVPGRQPWLDIAAAGDKSEHPPDPVIKRSEQAGFWYNPTRGVFRARVVPQFSEEATLELYNTLNATNLRALPRGDAHRVTGATKLAGWTLLEKRDDTPATARAPRTLRDAPPQQATAPASH